MKRKFVAVILILTMLAALGINASAAEARATRVTPVLTFDGTSANCEVRITEFGKRIEATLELWQGNTLIDSWTGSASNRLIISETCTVVRGQTYTLKVSGTIGGEAFEGTPVSARCN